VSVGAVVACCALAACTQEPARTSSPSPTPLATTPSESQIERQMRLDYEAAERAYRTNMAEQDRLYKAGGAVEATPVLKATATGSYLRISLKSLRDVYDAGWRATAGTRILGVVRDGGWKAIELDSLAVRTTRSSHLWTNLGRTLHPMGLLSMSRR
jgi:hypothetical protein